MSEKRLNIRISEEELSEIKEFAARQGKTVTDFMMHLVRSEMGKSTPPTPTEVQQRLERLEAEMKLVLRSLNLAA